MKKRNGPGSSCNKPLTLSRVSGVLFFRIELWSEVLEGVEDFSKSRGFGGVFFFAVLIIRIFWFAIDSAVGGADDEFKGEAALIVLDIKV